MARFRWVTLALALVGVGCSRKSDDVAARDASTQALDVAAAVASADAAASVEKKAFGAFCVSDAECVGGVCFHKRIKGADAGPERRDVRPEAEEHDGFCSMRCDSEADCPVPPTHRKCGARGMCK